MTVSLDANEIIGDELRRKAEQILNKIIGDVIADLRQKMEYKVKQLPQHLI